MAAQRRRALTTRNAASAWLLALETATPALSVALLRGETLIAERRAQSAGDAAAHLLVEIDALLREVGIDLPAVEAFAVSIGPGSFTGLRVGIATLKGLAFGSGRPALPVPTLAALARSAPEGDLPVVPMLDARRDEFFCAAYTRDGEALPDLLPESVLTAEALAERIPRPCVLVGDGAAIAGGRVRARAGDAVQLAPPPATGPAARHVGALAASQLARGAGVDPADLVPRYLRRAEAEVKRTGQRFEGG